MQDLESHRIELRRFIARQLMPAEEVDDLVQETLLRAYQAQGARSIHSPRAFLYATAKNLVVDHQRRKAARREELAPWHAFDTMQEPAHTPEESASTSQRLKLLRRAILLLPPRCRVAFILRKFHQLSYRRIAERMEVSEKTVEKHLARAVLLCRQFVVLAEQGRTEAIVDFRSRKPPRRPTAASTAAAAAASPVRRSS